jgi:hypothetical protein
MFAAAIVAGHAQRLALSIDDDDGVHAIFVARAAVVFH